RAAAKRPKKSPSAPAPTTPPASGTSLRPAICRRANRWHDETAPPRQEHEAVSPRPRGGPPSSPSRHRPGAGRPLEDPRDGALPGPLSGSVGGLDAADGGSPGVDLDAGPGGGGLPAAGDRRRGGR